MSRSVAILLALTVAFLAACSESDEKQAQLVIVCVWSGLDPAQLHCEGASHNTTPNLTSLAMLPDNERVREFDADEGEVTPEFATILTCVPMAEHGLISLREPGRERLAAGVKTWVELVGADGWKTLASVSNAKFGIAGLQRGFDHWHAPDLEQGARSASEVVEAVAADLREALRNEERVLLVLHFDEMRRDRWRRSQDVDSFFEQRMAPFRGKGGPVDEAFDAEGEENDVVQRLQRRLYRQGVGEAREALEASLYGAQLEGLDAAFGSAIEIGESSDASVSSVVVSGRFVAQATGTLEVVPKLFWWELENVGPTRELHVENRVSQQVDIGLKGEGMGVQFIDAGPGINAVGSMQAVSLEFVGEATYALKERGVSARLALQGSTSLFDQVWIGGRPLSQTDLCELHPSSAFDWPVDAAIEPALEVLSLGGRREQVKVNGSGEFELVIESFPPNTALLGKLDEQGLVVREHRYRSDAVIVSGSAPLEFELPPLIPSARMGLAFVLDGQRVAGSRIRYRGRYFSVPRRIELGLSPGVWIDPLLRGVAPEGTAADISGAQVAIELVDSLPANADYNMPTRAEREFLQGIDDQ